MLTRRLVVSALGAGPVFGFGTASAVTLPEGILAGSAVRAVIEPLMKISIGTKTYKADASGNVIFPTPIVGDGKLTMVVFKKDGSQESTTVAYAGRAYARTKVEGLDRLAGDGDIPEDPETIIKVGPPQMGGGEDALTVKRKATERSSKLSALKRSPPISAYANKFVAPVKTWRVTSEWGSIREKHYKDGRVVETPHMGLDLGGKRPGVAQEIYSPADGEVVLVGDDYFYEGNCVIIAHGGQLVTSYYHMVSPSTLKLGQMVKQGELLGTQGTTGSSTAVHLCWRAQIGGDVIDPRSLM